MAIRTTITLREKDYELLERLKEALDMPTSQTLGVVLRVADIIRQEQAAGHDIVFRSEEGDQRALIMDFSHDQHKSR